MAEPSRYTLREDDVIGSGPSRPGQGAGPLATLSNNPFKFSAYNYPDDIERLSHAILFNINVHEQSADLKPGGREKEIKGSFVDFDGQISRDNFKSRQSKLSQGQSLGLTRKYKRVARAISLYVPDTVVFDNSHRYETPSLLEKLGFLGTAGATALSGGTGINLDSLRDAVGLGNALLPPGVESAARQVANAVGATAAGAAVAFGATAGSNFERRTVLPAVRAVAQAAGYALNPIIEVLYVQPALRNYNFNFVFSPRSQKEADMVWQIIYEFRRHSAPEFTNIGVPGLGELGNIKGLFLIPPSEFDITYLRKTPSGFIENTNMPRMSTCVLSQVMVDYASAGQFATFEDGMPIQITMTLHFIELNIITREAIDKGY